MRDGALYRVFPHDPAARRGMPGHPLFVPATALAAGRADNPDLYRALYASSTPEGAVGEALARFPAWDASVLIGRDGRVRALARFHVRTERLRDLDDPDALREHGLKPSGVATPEREVTQAWARRIFEERRWIGVSWWSVRDARWSAAAIWNPSLIRATPHVEPLTLDHPALRGAAEALRRPILA